MTNTPSETEIDNLLCKHWPGYSRQAVLVKMWLREAIESAIAKWAAPQQAPATQQAAPKAALGVGNSGFDHQTAADFLSGKTVSDEAVRKFVAASRWAHDERAALSATLLAMHGVLTSREAEIALLKKALLAAEAAPQQEAQGLVLEGYTLPPLSEPDLRDVGTKPQDIKDFLRGYATEYAKQALRFSQPAPAPLSDDTKRLAWMADEWTPGHEKLYDKHVLETGGVGGLDDLRTFIDKQIAAQGGQP